MAYKLLKSNGVYLENVNEFVCDDATDLASIPTTGLHGATFGSVAVCVDTQKVYMYDSTGNWVTPEAADDTTPEAAAADGGGE